MLRGQSHSHFSVASLGHDQEVFFPFQEFPGTLSYQVVIVGQ
jgi:hypothetical protein